MPRPLTVTIAIVAVIGGLIFLASVLAKLRTRQLDGRTWAPIERRYGRHARGHWAEVWDSAGPAKVVTSAEAFYMTVADRAVVRVEWDRLTDFAIGRSGDAFTVSVLDHEGSNPLVEKKTPMVFRFVTTGQAGQILNGEFLEDFAKRYTTAHAKG